MDVILASEYDKNCIAKVWEWWEWSPRILNEIDKIITQNIKNANICELGKLNSHIVVSFHNYIQSNNKESIFPIESIRVSRSQKKEILINLDNKHLHLSLCLPTSYPFRSPKVLSVNGENYSYILKTDVRDLVRLGFNANSCLCCSSLTCRNNWSPTNTIESILTEIEKYLLIKRAISNLIHCRVIKRKYLIDDINIMKYLFSR